MPRSSTRCFRRASASRCAPDSNSSSVARSFSNGSRVKAKCRRYSSAPLADERPSFLHHLRESGSGTTSLRHHACSQLRLVRFLELTDGQSVSVVRIEAAVRSAGGGSGLPRQASASVIKVFVVKQATTRRVEEGDPYLEPLVADQLDLALEWYPAPDSVFAVAAFGKRVDSFVVRATVERMRLVSNTGRRLQAGVRVSFGCAARRRE